MRIMLWEIEKKVQIWDVEEENCLLHIRIREPEREVKKPVNRVNDLERWCGHLQGIIDAETQQREKREQQYQQYQQLEQSFGIFFRIAGKIR